MYSDTITTSMKNAMKETNRRRKKQMAYNKKMGVIPKTIIKPISNEINRQIINMNRLNSLNIKMKNASDNLNFEEAMKYRNIIHSLKNKIKPNS